MSKSLIAASAEPRVPPSLLIGVTIDILRISHYSDPVNIGTGKMKNETAKFSTLGPTDAGLLIEHGASRLVLILFGLTGVAAGLLLWHGQSRFFFSGSQINQSRDR